MSANLESANSNNKQAPTVVQQVLAAFYSKLGEKAEYKEVAKRLESENNFNEAAIRVALFGEEGK